MGNLPKFERIKHIALTPGMKLIVMSDMHRGDGSGADDFAQNSLIYRCALEYYLENGFTYIELGDAEELWENDKFDQIYITHTPVYELLAKFHEPDPGKTRYLKVWGNHDLYWKGHQDIYQSLFPGIQIYEAVVLNDSILMIHGHQADPMCSGPVAAVSQFFVNHIWADLQRTGIKDPTRAATNPGLCNEVDERLHKWASRNDKGITAIIAGHTHRAVFENLSITERRYLEAKIKTDGVKINHQADMCYFNAGSCVHLQSITGIEIILADIPHVSIVEWCQAYEENKLFIKRTILLNSTSSQAA
ncbi:MAG: metallophosphoesterase [Syntrophales bacterium]|jgi:predicted phosphodiesterase